MSGQSKATKSLFIPAPVDGLNLIANPIQLLATEARRLHNYFVYDWGIRERGATSLVCNSVVDQMFTAYNTAGVKRLFLCSGGTIERLDNTSDTTPTDITGTATLTNVAYHACQFNNRMFFFSLSKPPAVYNLSTEANCADTTFTGPTLDDVLFGFPYKSRMYFIERNATTGGAKVWYGGVDAVTGAMTSVDFASILEHNAHLSYGFSYTFNQGDTNSELFCLGNETGDLLIYSGDYPAATNWQLTAKIKLPELARYYGDSYPFVIPPLKFGAEMLIATRRGILGLSSVLGGILPADSYVQFSRKLGSAANQSNLMALDPREPFIYVVPQTLYLSDANERGFYVLNYERGAWSTIGTADVCSVAVGYEGYLYYSQPDGVYRINLTTYGAGEDSAADSSKPDWRTPYFDFGSHNQKHSKHVRLLGRDKSSEYEVRATCFVKTDYIDNGVLSSGDSRAKTTGDTSTEALCELAPAGVGTRLSYIFKKTPTGEKNDILGFEAVVEEGGRY